jgi:MtaA/CmuA family methyltransferase
MGPLESCEVKGKAMTGRDLLLRAIRNEVIPRPAWVPFVGAHGASLIGVGAEEYLKDAGLIVKGLKKAYDLYQPDGLPIVFDLQMEAEVLGCQLHWAKQGPPSVMTHPLEQGKSLADLPAFDAGAGRFPVAMQALATLKADLGEKVALYGLICGPFTLALHLLGNNIFLDMFDKPEYVKAVVSYCASVGIKVAQAYLENGADVIGVVDPMTSQISPEHFREFCSSPMNQVFDFVRSRGALSSLFVCGDATRNLEVMGQTTCDNMSIDENIPLEKIRDVTRAHDKSFGGNLRLTVVLLMGDEDDAKLDAIRCIDIGGGCGYVLAPGCDLPFATPARNLQAVSAMVHDAYQREIAKRTITAKAATGGVDIKLPDYDRDRNLYIDVITLDSASCAPCQYMMDAVHRAVTRIGGPVCVAEHRITTREGLAMMARLGVSNLPTICIDGVAKFISLIPDQNTLVAAIQERITAKASGQGGRQ